MHECVNATMRECENEKNVKYQISGNKNQIKTKFEIQKFKPVLQVEYLGFE
jgi:ribosomal protein L33